MNDLTIAFLAIAIFEGCVLIAMVIWVLLREAYIRSLVRDQAKFATETAVVLSKVMMTIENSTTLSKESKDEILNALDKLESRLMRTIEANSSRPGFSHGPHGVHVTNFSGEVGGAQFGNNNEQK